MIKLKFVNLFDLLKVRILFFTLVLNEDIRKAEKVFGRSINLALSHRGEEALREIGLEKEVTKNGIPMYGRMIHNLDGSTHSIPYGKSDQVLYRSLLMDIINATFNKITTSLF